MNVIIPAIVAGDKGITNNEANYKSFIGRNIYTINSANKEKICVGYIASVGKMGEQFLLNACLNENWRGSAKNIHVITLTPYSIRNEEDGKVVTHLTLGMRGTIGFAGSPNLLKYIEAYSQSWLGSVFGLNFEKYVPQAYNRDFTSGDLGKLADKHVNEYLSKRGLLALHKGMIVSVKFKKEGDGLLTYDIFQDKHLLKNVTIYDLETILF